MTLIKSEKIVKLINVLTYLLFDLKSDCVAEGWIILLLMLIMFLYVKTIRYVQLILFLQKVFRLCENEIVGT